MATTPVDPEPGDAVLTSSAHPGATRTSVRSGAADPASSDPDLTEPRDDRATEYGATEYGATDDGDGHAHPADPTWPDGTRLGRPGVRRPARRGAPLPVAAVVAAAWAAIISYGPVLALTAVAAAGAPGGFPATARLAVGVWLLGQGVPLPLAGVRVTLIPLAIGVLAGWRLLRAGVHTSRAIGAHRGRTVGPALAAGVAAGLAYGGVGALAAWVARTPVADYEPWRALLTLAGFGALFGVLGAIRAAQAGRALGDRIPLVIRDAVRSGFVAAVLIVAAGAGAAGVALAVRGGTATELFGSYQPGFVGQAGITLLCLVYLPNMAMWGAAYLLGPGFAMGADTLISPGEVFIGPVPAVPVLAGLPTTPLTGFGPALLAIPLAAGICAGLLLNRRRRTEWGNLLGAAVLAGPVAGALLQFFGLAASGALGSGRLVGIGAVTWWVSLLGTIVVSVGCVVAALTIRAVTHNP